MVKIKKYGTILTVTRGAYKSLYKKLGFDLCDEDLEETINSAPDEEEEDPDAFNHNEGNETEDDEEEDSDEEEEKPLSEMNKAELLNYADHLGLDVADNMNKGQLRALIAEALQE